MVKQTISLLGSEYLQNTFHLSYCSFNHAPALTCFGCNFQVQVGSSQVINSVTPFNFAGQIEFWDGWFEPEVPCVLLTLMVCLGLWFMEGHPLHYRDCRPNKYPPQDWGVWLISCVEINQIYRFGQISTSYMNEDSLQKIPHCLGTSSSRSSLICDFNLQSSSLFCKYGSVNGSVPTVHRDSGWCICGVVVVHSQYHISLWQGSESPSVGIPWSNMFGICFMRGWWDFVLLSWTL